MPPPLRRATNPCPKRAKKTMRADLLDFLGEKILAQRLRDRDVRFASGLSAEEEEAIAMHDRERSRGAGRLDVMRCEVSVKGTWWKERSPAHLLSAACHRSAERMSGDLDNFTSQVENSILLNTLPSPSSCAGCAFWAGGSIIQKH